MLITLYAELTASPLWWVFLLCCLIVQICWSRTMRPTGTVRIWQVGLTGSLGVAIFNLVYHLYPPAAKYVIALFFMGAAAAVLFSAHRITNALMRRKPDSATLMLLLSWLLSAPAFFIVSGFCLFAGLGILLFVP